MVHGLVCSMELQNRQCFIKYLYTNCLAVLVYKHEKEFGKSRKFTISDSDTVVGDQKRFHPGLHVGQDKLASLATKREKWK